MHITYSGGLSVEERTSEIYLNEEVLLRVNEDINGEKVGSGYYQTDDGLATVELKDDKLYGTGEVTDYQTSDYCPPFTFSGVVFDDNGDGSFTLKTEYGFENYIQYTAPDFAYNFNSCLYYLDEGSYTITFNDDESVTFSYDYSYSYYGSIIHGSIEVIVYDIGSTTNPYPDFVPYEEPSYASWDDFGDEAVILLEKYLTSDYNDILPLIDVEVANSFVNWRETTFQGTTYAWLTLSYANNQTMNEVLASYREQLLLNGWEEDVGLTGNNHYYRYKTEDGSYLHLALVGAGSYLYVRLYERTTSLGEWLTRSFSTSIESTLVLEKSESVYLYDEENNAVGELETNTTNTATYLYHDDVVERTIDEETMYFVEDTSGNFIIYTELSDGSFAILTSYTPDYGYTIESYASAYSYIYPKALLGQDAYFQEVNGEDGIYQPLAPQVITTVLSLLFNDSLTSGLDASMELRLVPYNNSLMIEITESYLSGEGETLRYHETKWTATFSRIGSTYIDTSALPLLESL